jgi:hypothetical protein
LLRAALGAPAQVPGTVPGGGTASAERSGLGIIMAAASGPALLVITAKQ